ncbi:hypothetical protein N7462_008605 [Penicillium macrosclerotiorum]|uniref:uncharacterized protein n=1 Tax=Penicillium macrosclerotiorum TaxID=303699 RepID=UPI0025477236|nr:uncharacterized protein N7462_008605 [Penicillium macrosclerotiorum]KAJ5675708.1 hypothetical protein N7462_008605 [Penicillium macrosclerotiorum]
MKPLPFPLPFNIGTDIVHLPRITRLLQRPGYLTRFTRRILSEHEQHDFHVRFKDTIAPNFHSSSCPPSNVGSQPPITPEMTRWLAGRFAAKEAARKAAPDGAASIGWKDVVVRTQEARGTEIQGTSRRPEVVYLGPDAHESLARVGRLSISHDGDYVVATVLAAG